MANFRHDHTDDVGSLLLQRLRQLIGLVVVLLGGFRNLALGFLRNIRMIAQGAGNRRRRNAEFTGEVLDSELRHGLHSLPGTLRHQQLMARFANAQRHHAPLPKN